MNSPDYLDRIAFTIISSITFAQLQESIIIFSNMLFSTGSPRPSHQII